MIYARDAIETARKMLGTPYSKVDCNMLIIRIIRDTVGGDASYRCSGTNWLFNSFKSTGKYQYLKTLEKINDDYSKIKPGMLVFRYDYNKNSCEHVGLYIGEGAVIHSSSVAKQVCETTIEGSGFNYCATIKFIQPETDETKQETKAYSADDEITINDKLDEIKEKLDFIIGYLTGVD